VSECHYILRKADSDQRFLSTFLVIGTHMSKSKTPEGNGVSERDISFVTWEELNATAVVTTP
jgi:hypothetical protein